MYSYPFADFNEINETLNALKIESHDKLAFIHDFIGGKFFDRDQTIMSGPAAAIVSIGGIATEIKNKKLHMLGKETTIEELKSSFDKSIGMSSFMSYLNPKNKTLDEIAETTLSLKHNSVLHQINISILLTGISIGVEHEFSSQRDIVHLSRITVAKTKAQKSPCLVLQDEKYLEAYKAVLTSTNDILKEHNIENNEIRNLLFPTSKASGLIINGSIKNLMKLISLKDAGGKEDEFVKALEKIEHTLKGLIDF